jgi:hypothetical protein
MNNFLLAVALLVCSITAHAQTQDEIAVVATVKTILTDKDDSKVYPLLTDKFRIYGDNIGNNTVIMNFEHYKKPDVRVIIPATSPLRLVAGAKTASVFCVSEKYRGTSKEAEERIANAFFLTKENNVWKVNLWQRSPYKNDYSEMDFGN